MKKLLVTLMAMFVTFSAVNAAEETADVKFDKKPPYQHKIAPDKIKRERAFEQKLGLTDEQKVQAKELRKQGFEKMKPVMDELKAKKQEAKTLRTSDTAIKDQSEQLKAIDKDVKKLEKQIREIRKENMKEFEAILTKDQQKTLKDMKAEGRKNFKANHPYGRPPKCQHHTDIKK